MRREVTTLKQRLSYKVKEKAPKKMHIHVKEEYDGHTVTLHVMPTNTVSEVKQLFNDATGPWCQILFCFKEELLQEDFTLEFYKIKNMDMILSQSQ